jgi:hypothetical protein
MAFDSQVRKRLELEEPGSWPTANQPQHKNPSGVAAALAPRCQSLRNSLAKVGPMPSLRDLAIVLGEHSRRFTPGYRMPRLRRSERMVD